MSATTTTFGAMSATSTHGGYRCMHVNHGRIPLRRNDTRRSSMHLTRRGRMVSVMVLIMITVAFVIVGAMRATAAPTDPPVGWSPVVVQPGDTLWSLAADSTEGSDPRAVIAEIKAVNGLVSSQVHSGQRLLLPR